MRIPPNSFVKAISLAVFLLATTVVVAAQSAIRKIAFTYGGGAISSTIAVINEDGSGQTRLTEQGASDTAPSWSPDGTQIVFQSNRLGGRQNIFRINADGSGRIPLTDWTQPVSYIAPCWSPDGSTIAFTSDRGGVRRGEIWLMNSDGTNLRKLTTNVQVGSDSSGPYYALDHDPSWAPDGSRIAFWSTRDNPANPEIYTIAVDGSSLTRLTNNNVEDRDPVWSPDSQHIAFSSRRDGLNGIYVIDANGANDHRITDGSSPSWSPDGTRLVVTAFDANFVIALYKVNLDGSNRIKITNNSIDSSMPAWAPLSPPPVPTYSISGRVTDGSSSGLSQVTLSLSSLGESTKTTQSDASGDYSFPGLGRATYQLVATKPGYAFNPTAYNFESITENRIANFSAYLAFSISGRVTGLNGNIGIVTLSGSQNRTTQTEPNGTYSFSNLPAGGNFTLTPARSCYDFTPVSRTFDSLSANQLSVDFAAQSRTTRFSGRVTRLGTGKGMGGVTVAVYFGIGPPLPTVTDENGYYSFTGVNGGHFMVASKPNYYFNPSSRDINSCEVTGADFVGYSANTIGFGDPSYVIGENGCSLQIPVFRGGNAAGVGPITVDYASANGSASAGSDYTAVSGTLNFPDGTHSRTIVIPIPDDSLIEGNETFSVILSNPTGEVDLSTSSTATVTIADNDPVAAPELQLELKSDYAIALNSVTLQRDPFTILDTHNFSSDQRTRILLFLANGRLTPCEDLSVITVQGEDSAHQLHQLTVESVRAVPNLSGLTQVVVKLPDGVSPGDMLLTVRLRGVVSNQARIRILSSP